MTEAEWLECTDPQKMLESLWGKASDRKLRLFAVACCRRVWDLLTDGRSQKALGIAEGFADGLVGESERRASAAAAINVCWDLEEDDRSDWPTQAVCHTIDPGQGVDAAAVAHYAAVVEDELPAQAALLRDIFGNPFRPPPRIDPAWLAWNGRTVEKLARAAYDERQLPSGHSDPARLAILADALEEAGCTDEDTLSHLRWPGPHTRGCWPVDLLLGKE